MCRKSPLSHGAKWKSFISHSLSRKLHRLCCGESVAFQQIIYSIFRQTQLVYTECPGGNVPDFGRMFLTLKYTDITQNTYILS